MADKNEADSPDESASAATPGDSADNAANDSAGDSSVTDSTRDDDRSNDDTSDVGGDPHVAADGSREPSLEELEQMLEGDDPANHDGADVESSDEPAELANAVDDDSQDDSDDSDDSGGPGDAELVSVGATPRSRSKTAAADGDEATGSEPAGGRKQRQKKDKATPKQKQEVEKRKRTTPVGFVKESAGELRKVVYPTAPQLGNYFVVVLVFVLVIIGFVALLDLGFGALVVKVFG